MVGPGRLLGDGQPSLPLRVCADDDFGHDQLARPVRVERQGRERQRAGTGHIEFPIAAHGLQRSRRRSEAAGTIDGDPQSLADTGQNQPVP